MGKAINGSVCITDIIEQAKKGHSAFSKSEKNGKVYCNIVIWENDELDKYGNSHALQLSSTKEKREAEGKIYIGNAKTGESKPVTNSDLPKDDWDSNVQTREPKPAGQASDIYEPVGDLPF